MPHHDYSRPPALWTPAAVPNARDLKHWDDVQHGGLDGDAGGTWTPSTPISIGGQGVQLDNNSVLSGGISTQSGGRLVVGTSDSTTPAFATPRTRVLRAPLRGVSGGTGCLYQGTSTIAGRQITRQGWYDPSAASVWFPIDQRYIHNGATLGNIAITAFILRSPAPTPTITFQALLWQTDAGETLAIQTPWAASYSFAPTQLIIPLTATKQTGFCYENIGGLGISGSVEPTWPTVLGGTVVDGTVTWQAFAPAGTIAMPSPFTPQAYYNNSQLWTVQVVSFPLVMSATSTYAIQVVQDANNSWVYCDTTITYTGIPNMAFP